MRTRETTMPKRAPSKAHRMARSGDRKARQLRADHQSALKALLQTEKERLAAVEDGLRAAMEVIKETEAERDILRVRLRQIQGDEGRFLQETFRAQSEVVQLRSEVATLRREQDQLEQDRAKLKAELWRQRDRADSLQVDLKIATDQLGRCHKIHDQLRGENDELRRKLRGGDHGN